MNFWDRVEALRRQQDVGRKELGALLNVSIKTIDSWVLRGYVPAGDVCVAIARKLGASVEFLITGEDTADDDDDYSIIGKASGKRIIEDTVFRIIADDPILYRAAQIIAMDKEKGKAVLTFAGERLPISGIKKEA